jgi:hypothetical protein
MQFPQEADRQTAANSQQSRQRRSSIRRWVIALTSVFLLPYLLATPVYAQGCTSTAEAAAQIWDEYGKAARNMGCATGGTGTAIVSGGIALPAAAAQYSQCIGNDEKAEKLTEHMVEFYNENRGRDEWGGIGPRPLEPGTSEEGFSPSSDEQHTFITAPLQNNEMKLELGRLSGLGKIDVTACTWLPVEGGGRAKAKEVWSTRIDGTGSEWSTNLSGLEGRILTVLLTPERVAIPINRFKYRVSTPVIVPDQNDPMRNFTIEYGYDRAGSDYRDFDLDEADPSQCQKVCAENDRCKAFTYVKPGMQGNAARCWLKDEVAGRSEAPGLVSGIKGGASQKSGDVDMTEVTEQTETPGAIANIGGDETPTTWTAVWRPGDGAQRWRSDMTKDEFKDRDQQHFQNGLRLVDLKVDDETYGAVWRAGSGAQRWRSEMSMSTFKQADQKHFNNGLRLVDMEVENGAYTAVWRTGNGAQRWHAGLSRREFKRQDQTYFNQDLRLVDIEIDDGQYTAVWRAGSGAQRWHTDMTKDEIQTTDKKYFDQGLRLADVEVHGEKYTAVWKAGTGGQWWRTEMSTDQFGTHDQSYFQDGFRLIDMETSAP